MFILYSFLWLAFSPFGSATDFPESYQQSRHQFRELSQQLQAQHPLAKLETHHLDRQQDLTIESLYIPGDNNKLIMITTGLHGIEAFAGSALLFHWMQHLKSQDSLPNSYLLVHATNPWGYKHKRRVTENNIDLNRNLGRQSFAIKETSRELDAFLNPQAPVRAGGFHDLRLFVKSLWYLMVYGRQQLTQVAVGGQYYNPTGIYFGGQKSEPHKEILKNLWLKTSQDSEQVLHLDIHTGYGERGQLHFFASAQDRDNPQFKQVFQDHSMDFEDDKNFYKTSGSFTDFTRQTLTNKKVLTMTLEFGTLDSQTLLGGFASLRNMIHENQGYHHGAASPQDDKRVKQRFKEMFAPSDSGWQQQMLEQGHRAIDQIRKRFHELSQ